MKFKRALCTPIAAILLSSCSASMKPSPAGPSALVVASCPEIAPLSDPSFGATTLKLIEVGQQYRECRLAGLLQFDAKARPALGGP